MAKSKLININKKIEDNVVSAFNKIETSVTNSYTKIENAFVDRYLTKDGESVENAKQRLKKEKNFK